MSDLIERYKIAYEAANKKSAPHIIEWSKGWYKVGDLARKYRAKQLEKMIEVLTERASS